MKKRCNSYTLQGKKCQHTKYKDYSNCFTHLRKAANTIQLWWWRRHIFPKKVAKLVEKHRNFDTDCQKYRSYALKWLNLTRNVVNLEHECTICLEYLTNKDEKKMNIIKLPCGHYFHMDCIIEMFMETANTVFKCPNCRNVPSTYEDGMVLRGLLSFNTDVGIPMYISSNYITHKWKKVFSCNGSYWLNLPWCVIENIFKIENKTSNWWKEQEYINYTHTFQGSIYKKELPFLCSIKKVLIKNGFSVHNQRKFGLIKLIDC